MAGTGRSAITCARTHSLHTISQNVNAEMMDFITRLAWAELPAPGRSYGEPLVGRKSRQIGRWRLICIPTEI